MLTVITGPPCSGKSTYITERAQLGDIIIDMDRLALALTTEDTPHHEYGDHIRDVAMRARRSAVTAAIEKHHHGHTVWIIDTDPSKERRHEYRKHGGNIVDLDPGLATCLARAEGQRPPGMVAYLYRWYGVTPPPTPTVKNSRAW